MEIQVNNLTAPERLDLGRMLLKAGYTAQMTRRHRAGKASGAYDYYIKAEMLDDKKS